MRRESRAIAVMIAMGMTALTRGSSAVEPRGGEVPRPVVEGPVSGGLGVPGGASTMFDLSEVGYVETEFFISGTARAWTSEGTLGIDGMWTARPGETAPYKTRIRVCRPIDADRFNGTVIVEWLNVSGGIDAAADWIMMHTELIRSGYAWAGVSAQFTGVEGGASLMGMESTPLKTIDPERYGALSHPGDSFSFDIFSQAAQALRRPDGTNPLGEVKPADVAAIIAVGESQSAFRLVTYANAIHPVADVYDGFLIHSRGGNNMGSAGLSQSPQPAIRVPGASRIRADLNVPVLTFQTESDLTFLGSVHARQEDSDRFRLWEVAGTAHADTYTVVTGMTDRGDSPEAARLVVTTDVIPGMSCAEPINSGPQHFVLKAAVSALNRWVREGVPPPTAPLLELTGDKRTTIARDADGNALGGIRTPQTDVPIAALSGDPQRGSMMCMLFGSTRPFDAARLKALYPTRESYLSAFTEATQRAVDAGFILKADAELMLAAARTAAIPE